MRLRKRTPMAKSNATPRNPKKSAQKRRVTRSRPTSDRAHDSAPKAFGIAVPAGLKLPPGISVKKSRHVLDGAGDVSFDISAQPGSDVLASLLANAPFPRRKIDVTELSVGATA